ncbi:hypothetical protein [Streptomyces sp. NPDC048191]
MLAAHDVQQTTDAVIDVYREPLGTVTTPALVPARTREPITT